MRNSITKTVLAAVAALGMATAVATISTPAEAQWHGGGGGFHGGGFHGRLWRGLSRRWMGRWRLARRGLAWRRMGRRLAWRLGPSRMGRRLGLAPRRLGSRLGAVGAAAAGIAAGAVVGAGGTIPAGRSQPRRCRSGSQSRPMPPSRSMAVQAAG